MSHLLNKDAFLERYGGAIATNQEDAGMINRIRLHLDRELVDIVAGITGMVAIDLSQMDVDPTVSAHIAEPVARRCRAVPVEVSGGELTVAFANPFDQGARREVEQVVTLKTRVAIASIADVSSALERLYPRDIQDVRIEDLLEPFDHPQPDEIVRIDSAEERCAVALVRDALCSRAQSLLLEPEGEHFRVRHVRDGVLVPALRVAPELTRALGTFLMIRGGLNIVERKVPQMGWGEIDVDGRPVEIGVFTMPTVAGLMFRIAFRNALAPLALSDLGLTSVQMDDFMEAIRPGPGVVLIGGSGGSGKTTTLYAALRSLDASRLNILTAEDPVQAKLDGVHQVQCIASRGLNYASVIRQAQRLGTDIIMIPELCEKETTDSLFDITARGAKALAAMYVKDAVSVLQRLHDMGIEPFLIADQVRMVQAQVLVRRLCEKCAESFDPPLSIWSAVGLSDGGVYRLKNRLAGNHVLRRARGCAECGMTGYAGQFGLFEQLKMTEAMKEAVIGAGRRNELRKVAQMAVLVSLREAGIARALDGETSLEEVIRCTPGA